MITDRLERYLRQTPREVERLVEDDLPRGLAGWARRLAPRVSGRLRRSFDSRDGTVTTSVDYAEIVDRGGAIRARAHGYLVVPVRPGVRPLDAVTVGPRGNQIIVRSGTYELWAVRRREVRIRGTRYLQRAEAAHLPEARAEIVQELQP